MWYLLLLVIRDLPKDPLHEIPISNEHEDVPVDVGFCEGNDHLQIGIGGSRFGGSNGIYAKFELWASEEDIARMFDIVVATDGDPIKTLVKLTVVGWNDQGWTDAVLNALRTEPKFLAQMKAILLKQVRLFRESAIVARQTALYQAQRTGTASTT